MSGRQGKAGKGMKTRATAAADGKAWPRKAINFVSTDDPDQNGRNYAGLITSPELAAYRIIGMLQPKNVSEEIDAPGMLDKLREQAAAAQRGDLGYPEAMLINQASALQAIFVRLVERAAQQSHMPNYEGFMRLALKAQSQCRASLETLAQIKNPPVVYAKQANIAAGHQQVNNNLSPPTRAGEIETGKPNYQVVESAQDRSPDGALTAPATYGIVRSGDGP